MTHKVYHDSCPNTDDRPPTRLTVHKMVTAVWLRERVFHFLVHREVEGVSGPRSVHDHVDAPYRVHVALVPYDAVQGVDDAAVVGIRVRHETLHPRLERKTLAIRHVWCDQKKQAEAVWERMQSERTMWTG